MDPPPSEEIEPIELQGELPPPRRRHPSPQGESASSESPAMDTRAIAAEVLHLLSNRHVERSQAKRAKYRSWFQNL